MRGVLCICYREGSSHYSWLSSPWMQCTQRALGTQHELGTAKVSSFLSTIYFPPDHKFRSLSWPLVTGWRPIWWCHQSQVVYDLGKDRMMQYLQSWLLGSVQYREGILAVLPWAVEAFTIVSRRKYPGIFWRFLHPSVFYFSLFILSLSAFFPYMVFSHGTYFTKPHHWFS